MNINDLIDEETRILYREMQAQEKTGIPLKIDLDKLKEQEKLKKEQEVLALKEYNKNIKENEVLKKNYGNPAIVNGNFHFFLKVFFVFFLIAILCASAYFLYLVNEDKLKDVISNINTINVPERNVTVNVNVPVNNENKPNIYNNFTIINKICPGGNSTC